MMKQYKDYKDRYPDLFMFFRCGDFYEIFGEDAVVVSKILNITLTKRGEVPMCGVPYHAVEGYKAKMSVAGKKFAMIEQVEDPKLAKGLVKREIKEIITPGTILEERLLNNKNNNFLLAINRKGLFIEIAYIDISTGDFEFSEIEWSDGLNILRGEIFRIAPREIIIPESLWEQNKIIRDIFNQYGNITVNKYPLFFFNSEKNNEVLFELLNIKSFSDIGISEPKTDITTPATLLAYLRANLNENLSHIRELKYNSNKEIMTLDEATIKNLEIITNQQDGSVNNTLLNIIDKTNTSMGGRLLKKWIIEPLIDIKKIEDRLNIVSLFYENNNLLETLNHIIKDIMDLERLCSRVNAGKVTPKDLISIKESLIACSKLEKAIVGFNELKEIKNKFKNLDELIEIIDSTIKEEPATFTNEGNIVKDGYNSELDELKSIALKTKEHIEALEDKWKSKYNIPTLKINYNKIIGYYFEVSKGQVKNVPEDLILRQSLVSSSRYTNRELNEYESKILTAKDEIYSIENRIFNMVRDRVQEKIHDIQDNAKLVAILDVYLSFAKVSLNNSYTKPSINNSNEIFIKDGRHPVIEKKLESDSFIPNSLDIDSDEKYIFIITGPNMAGKSTYLRQNALIVLMSQIGCFVPAKEAKIGIVDRIFTRVSASDNLAEGQSTFLVEMSETANILKSATKKSLIIVDEIGRGTSTYDGLSLAWAIVEYIHQKIGAKTLFATHYHELTKLESDDNGIKNFSVLVSEEDEKITFLHKIIDKPAEKSYGIYVAKLANIPHEVIKYADTLLRSLENEKQFSGNDVVEKLKGQLELFDVKVAANTKNHDEIINTLKNINIDNISPLQALNIIADLQKKIAKKK